MIVSNDIILIITKPKSLNEITDEVKDVCSRTRIKDGMLTIYNRHTSCSLMIMENADPSAIKDLEYFMDRLVPEGDPNYTHTYEGKDDMPSHIKMALTRTSESIPLKGGQILLGKWQGIFLWEHRDKGHNRELVINLQGT